MDCVSSGALTPCPGPPCRHPYAGCKILDKARPASDGTDRAGSAFARDCTPERIPRRNDFPENGRVSGASVPMFPRSQPLSWKTFFHERVSNYQTQPYPAGYLWNRAGTPILEELWFRRSLQSCCGTCVSFWCWQHLPRHRQPRRPWFRRVRGSLPIIKLSMPRRGPRIGPRRGPRFRERAVTHARRPVSRIAGAPPPLPGRDPPGLPARCRRPLDPRSGGHRW
jgi:hypothetical protein